MLSGKRQVFADALSTVDGVQGFAMRPKSNSVGDAWPVFGGLDRAVADSFEVTWRLFVVLPDDQAAADAWIDGHLDALYDAVEPVAYIDRFTPVELVDNQKRALEITVRAE